MSTHRNSEPWMYYGVLNLIVESSHVKMCGFAGAGIYIVILMQVCLLQKNATNLSPLSFLSFSIVCDSQRPPIPATYLACVASASFWFRSKERPRDRIFGFGRARTAWPFEISEILKSLCSLLFCYYVFAVLFCCYWYCHCYKSFYVNWKMKPTPSLLFYSHRLWLTVPRSLLRNRTETLTTRATTTCVSGLSFVLGPYSAVVPHITIIRDLNIRGRRRQRKRRWKNEFAFFQSSLRLLQKACFKRRATAVLSWLDCSTIPAPLTFRCRI